MKYIRTEKGVYEFTDEMCVNQFGHIAYKDRPFICVYGVGNNVISQADTIEELCDIYVSVYEEQLDNELFWANRYTPKEAYNFYPSKPKAVMGAVWTSKGLIYVAKMNEKGELELI